MSDFAMNHPALNTNRQVIFNPCVASGEKLTHEVAHAGSEILGLAYGNPKGEGIKLIRHATMGEAFVMLDAVGARFDLIVSAPPAGTVPAKGLPKPKSLETMAKPAGRKLFMDSATPAPAPEIDLGYAAWLVTNALLSPFGEAIINLSAESLVLVEKDRDYTRVWLRSLPDAETGRVELYIARDHRRMPGCGVAVGCPPNRNLIRGTTVAFWEQATTDSVKKFMIVRDELSRRALVTDDWNVVLDNNKLRTKFSPFAIESGAITRDLVEDAEALLHNKTLLDLAIMRDTRDRVKAILADKRLKVPPAVIAAFADVCRQMAILAAPFTRPSPVQRVAWLDEQDTIECIRDFHGFRAGEHYEIKTQTITGRKVEKRHRPGFGTEDVLVTGQEVLVSLWCDSKKGGDGFQHAFTQLPITTEMVDEWRTYSEHGAAHTLSELIINFAMPEVLDIAEADPTTYNKHRKRLEALQT